MELHDLKPVKGSVKKRKRIARGEGSGKGGTAARGHKGAKSRSGYKSKRGFEGGQMPLQMRLPKRGFKNPNRQEYNVFNLFEVQAIADKFGVTTIDVPFLKEKGYIQRTEKVKILSNGELTAALEVNVHAFSKAAQEAIEAKGGSAKLYE
ncbi:50S ribosomal protein L15 [Membranihabitans marinus]|uniref:50S ribosomal protein L15 n=1 Tax=Membranihabitans marinus TaxID=1227546 RepID=UPI001F02E183|nr:50S ribosomal protein L15 [Membranihabitans marinus]